MITAKDRYILNFQDAAESFERIKSFMDGHGNVSPDEITWADVGDMSRLADKMKDLADYVNQTGEYGEYDE